MQSTGQIEKHPESHESALPVGSNLLLLAPLLGCRLPLGPSMVMYGSVSYHLPLLGFYPSTFLLFICRQSYDPWLLPLACGHASSLYSKEQQEHLLLLQQQQKTLHKKTCMHGRLLEDSHCGVNSKLYLGWLPAKQQASWAQDCLHSLCTVKCAMSMLSTSIHRVC